MKSWAKWCERYGETNKTEECGRFLFALGKKFIQSVLEILWRPLSDFAKLFDALAQQRDNFVFGKLLESLVVGDRVHVDRRRDEEIVSHSAKIGESLETIVDDREDAKLKLVASVLGAFWPEICCASVESFCIFVEEATNPLTIEPKKLLFIEACACVLDTANIEALNKVLFAVDFVFGAIILA